MTKSKLETSWGYEGVLIDSALYSAKILVIKENEITSYGYNRSQDKTIYVFQGIVQLTIEGTNRILQEGDRYHIQPKIMHKMAALKGDATILEVGTKIVNDFVEVYV